jgi:beta-lactam-binding protein with PASTA domain
MPDFVGRPVVAVQAELAKVGMQTAAPEFADQPIPPIGSGNAPLTPPIPPGSVIAQEPAAGARVDLMTEVKLTVAR